MSGRERRWHGRARHRAIAMEGALYPFMRLLRKLKVWDCYYDDDMRDYVDRILGAR
jgi:hypothetical protein